MQSLWVFKLPGGCRGHQASWPLRTWPCLLLAPCRTPMTWRWPRQWPCGGSKERNLEEPNSPSFLPHLHCKGLSHSGYGCSKNKQDNELASHNLHIMWRLQAKALWQEMLARASKASRLKHFLQCFIASVPFCFSFLSLNSANGLAACLQP